MSNDVWQREELDSPCIQICIVHPETRLCIGCNRSIEEISRWSKMTSETRRLIMEELPSRQSAPTGRRGGRAALLKR